MAGQRLHIELTDEQRLHIERARQETLAELPDLLEQGRILRRAADEATLSGGLRRAVHASAWDLDALAEHIGVSTDDLDGFLRGERPLDSDALDRLATILGLNLVSATGPDGL